MPDPKRLAATLTAPARQALERAADAAQRDTHVAVEPEHLLLELCRDPQTDVVGMLRAQGMEAPPLLAALEATVARFARGSPRMPALSVKLIDILADAWVIASVDLGLAQAGSACILRAIHGNPSLRDAVLTAAPLLDRLFVSPLWQDLAEVVRLGTEYRAAPPSRTVSGQSALNAYTIDLTAQAHAGGIDPVIGRDAEIRQIIDVLMRRRQNNPILTGAAGVGKTAIVEGFVQAIADGRTPPCLSELVVRSLDLGLLQAGASLRGEYEQRLRAVLEEAAASTPRTVLFIDEAHMLIGAGGAAGQGDAANLLKPALARGTLGVIAATTWGEYKRFIEKDPALARRFQVINVAEPSEPVAVDMLRGLAPRLETHHGVRILEEALTEAARLSHRFISGRQLPEKAISVLDTACARVVIARSTPPAELEDAERACTRLAAELDRLRREAMDVDDQAERLEALEEAFGRAEERRIAVDQPLATGT